MNFKNEMFANSTNFSGSNVAPLSPLSIITPRQTSSSELWSPFSTPCFSPYLNFSPNSNFEFSSLKSPVGGTRSQSRPIAKSPLSTPRNFNALNELTNHQAYSFNSFSAGSSRSSMSPFNNFENMSPNSQWSFSQANVPLYQSPPASQYLTHQSSPTSLTKLPKRSEQIDMSDVIRQAAVQRALGGRAKLCTFCKTNGESEDIYTSHALKDANDKITCPILAKYSCPVCGANGEKTHTKRYCPVLQKKNKNEMLRKLTISSAPGFNESSNF